MATGRDREREHRGILGAAQQRFLEAASAADRSGSLLANETGVFTGPPARRRREAREAKTTAERATAARELGEAEGANLFSQFGFSPEQQQDPRVQSVQAGLAHEGTRQQSVQSAEDLQAEFGINQPGLSAMDKNKMAVEAGQQWENERTAAMQPLFTRNSQGAQLINNLNQGTGFGDIASTFNFFTYLDPGSRVTEGEIRLSSGASSFAQQGLVLWNRIQGQGGTMTVDQREEMAKIISGQQGEIRAEQIRLNDFFDVQVGRAMSAAPALAGLATQLSQTPFFRPDFELPEFQRTETSDVPAVGTIDSEGNKIGVDDLLDPP